MSTDGEGEPVYGMRRVEVSRPIGFRWPRPKNGQIYVVWLRIGAVAGPCPAGPKKWNQGDGAAQTANKLEVLDAVNISLENVRAHGCRHQRRAAARRRGGWRSSSWWSLEHAGWTPPT